MFRRSRSPVLSLILALPFFLTSSQSLRFDLQSGSGHTRCVSEDIKSNSMTVGKYHVVNPTDAAPFPDTHKITVRVTSSSGNSHHHSERVETGQFAFTAAESGDYTACFWMEDHKIPVTVTVDFEWRTGVAAKDWGTVVKKGAIDVMEIELKTLMDTINSIHDEMFYLRDREDEMQKLNGSTNSKMFWLSFLSLFICMLVAGLQFWHLKTFFERKKLL